MKCRRCIDYYMAEKRRMDSVRDVKPKNEGLLHTYLKTEVCELMRDIDVDKTAKIETEFLVKGIGKVDVVAFFDDASVAVECGDTRFEKIRKLEKQFDVVLHVPFCYSMEFYHLDREELEHKIFVMRVFNRLRMEGMDVEKGKPHCLEDGECSLPSGLKGYPHEAIEIASGRLVEKQTE